MIVVDRLEEFGSQRLQVRVLGKVQQVEAGVRYWQVVLPSTGGLDHQLQAFHAQDGDAVTSCQKHCQADKKFEKLKTPPLN